MPDGLLAADAEIRSHPDLGHTLSLVVARHGDVVFERFYRRTHATDLHLVHSVTKSFTSTLVGILAGDGLLSLDAPVASLVDAPAFHSDPAKKAITVRHLLTMASGLDCRGRWDIDEIAARGEPVLEGALDAPLLFEPGESFEYNNGASHVLSAVVEAVAGKPLPGVASERLFTPLGITRWKWPTDPQGHHWGCGGLRLSPRDLLKLGQLYLDGGRWNGTQLVHEPYVRMATSPLVSGGQPEQTSYGLLWWVADDRAPAMYFAGGYGGQYIVVVPELDLVVVTTADVDAVKHPKGQLLRTLVMWVVVPAFAASGG